MSFIPCMWPCALPYVLPCAFRAFLRWGHRPRQRCFGASSHAGTAVRLASSQHLSTPLDSAESVCIQGMFDTMPVRFVGDPLHEGRVQLWQSHCSRCSWLCQVGIYSAATLLAIAADPALATSDTTHGMLRRFFLAVLGRQKATVGKNSNRTLVWGGHWIHHSRRWHQRVVASPYALRSAHADGQSTDHTWLRCYLHLHTATAGGFCSHLQVSCGESFWW